MKEIKQLLEITNLLKVQYEGKLIFSLDGRLVGDIGEALVSDRFGIELYGKNNYMYDGIHKPSGKEVQIKASMAYNFSYPYDKDLQHYIAVHIEPNGELEIMYNGPGKPIHDFLKSRNRKSYRKIWYTISKKQLLELYEGVPYSDRIPDLKKK